MAKGKKVAPSATAIPGSNPNQLMTTSELAADNDLGYKIRVLIHDLRNISKDEGSQRRTLQTTDELYISSPYFTTKEASIIKGATCKRKASGDARSCGPHDLAPIYEAVFGIEKEEVQDEKFLSRLRRQGLPSVEDEPKPVVAAGPIDGKKKHKRK
ncbi:hypothetical protein PG993_006039 [Apiospora rasikravindrae]|uniref:Uncharacterized protein n=1 Tax=Apiospora rasikravindrae TaxID=990691 RepID=A0ABR1TCV7_9PEZI